VDLSEIIISDVQYLNHWLQFHVPLPGFCWVPSCCWCMSWSACEERVLQSNILFITTRGFVSSNSAHRQCTFHTTKWFRFTCETSCLARWLSSTHSTYHTVLIDFCIELLWTIWSIYSVVHWDTRILTRLDMEDVQYWLGSYASVFSAWLCSFWSLSTTAVPRMSTSGTCVRISCLMMTDL